MNLFDLMEQDGPALQVANDTWRPEAPPSLKGIDEIYLNCETTGLRWFEDDRPISISLYARNRTFYLPWKHSGAGNLNEETVKRWAKTELQGKRIVNFNTRFDVHMMRVWGIDLEAQGNTFSDVGHYASLLDDHRLRTNLDLIIYEFLHEKPMERLDESRMQSYSAGTAAARSMYNVDCVRRLKEAMYPLLDEQNLHQVRHLEDKIIPVVCEMEKNGAILDQELLHKWIKETKDRYHQGLMQLYRETGLKVNPNSNKDQTKLFNYLKVPITEFTDPTDAHPNGQPSFTEEVLKPIKHPTIKLLRQTKKFKSLTGKLEGYRDSVDSHGILRYALHQLRASKSETDDSGETGTVVGRFTSTEIVPGFGVNIQQVLKPEKQFLSFGDEFFVRELFIPEKGKKYLSSDAEQIQYRLAANKAKNPKVLAKYKEDPWMSFHKMTWKMFMVHKPDLPYKRAKDVNFAKMFVAGLTKMAFMLEEITKREMFQLRAEKAGRNHPKLTMTAEILKIYAREMPEMDIISEAATNLAETQGFVESILHRRMRFPELVRTYKAFNGEIIMSEADVVKTKLVELHDARKETQFLMRAQVHDEADGDIPDDHHAKKVQDILNIQSFPELEVPILWGMNTGSSWGNCAAKELADLRKQRELGII